MLPGDKILNYEKCQNYNDEIELCLHEICKKSSQKRDSVMLSSNLVSVDPPIWSAALSAAEAR